MGGRSEHHLKHPTLAVAVALLLSALTASGSTSVAKGTRRQAPARTPPPVVVSVRDGGFHWLDAGVGAAAAFAAGLIALGLVLALRPERKPAGPREALSSARKEER
jgi:hypothetical protein